MSNCVANKLKKFSYFSEDKVDQIEAFQVDCVMFETYYKSISDFYQRRTIKLANLTNHLLKIKYDDFKDNNQKFFDLLEINFKLRNCNYIPIKVPFDYKLLVTNYDELEKEFRI